MIVFSASLQTLGRQSPVLHQPFSPTHPTPRFSLHLHQHSMADQKQWLHLHISPQKNGFYHADGRDVGPRVCGRIWLANYLQIFFTPLLSPLFSVFTDQRQWFHLQISPQKIGFDHTDWLDIIGLCLYCISYQHIYLYRSLSYSMLVCVSNQRQGFHLQMSPQKTGFDHTDRLRRHHMSLLPHATCKSLSLSFFSPLVSVFTKGYQSPVSDKP